MPVEYFIRYQGKCYDVGTRLRFYPYGDKWLNPVDGVIEEFTSTWVFIRGDNGRLYQFSTVTNRFDSTVLEILSPVYYEEPPVAYRRGGVCPSEDAIFVGWVWYILIMLVGVIFNERLLIWVFATAVFFLWKNGFLNGGKKE